MMPIELSENARVHWRELADYDLGFLEEIVEVLDHQLERIDKEIEGHPDPDGWGLLDRFEYAVELGFIACQNYLTEVIGDRASQRDQLLALGPKHQLGPSIAEAVHAGGNYAKHHPEGLTNKKSIAVLVAFGVWRDGRAGYYQVANLHFELLKPERARFKTLLPLLEAWRDAVIATEV